MYKLLLTFKYLRRRLIPVFALFSVMLCTAMVIIVISVMGGFLDHLRGAGRSLMGDVSISAGFGGIAHYGELIDEIKKMPETEGATALIFAKGLLRLRGDRIVEVDVMGVNARELDGVIDLRETLFWDAARLKEYSIVGEAYPGDPVESALDMSIPWERFAGTGSGDEGGEKTFVPMVMGIEVSPFSRRTHEGKYEFFRTVFELNDEKGGMVLTVMPVTRKGGIGDASSVRVVAVNEFHCGVYETDSKQLYVPFDVAQRLMNMQKADRVDEETFEKVGTEPARATVIFVRGVPGVEVDFLRDKVEEVYARVAARHEGEMPPAGFAQVETWEQRMGTFLRTVENERGLMTVLFGIISFVAVLIVGVIFYMIVLEKTRDIGTLRAIGASKAGVASIFITFAGVVGTIGAGLGFVIAWLIVTNINEIHAWLGNGFPNAVFIAGYAMRNCLLITLPILSYRLLRTPRFPRQLSVVAVLGVLAGLVGWLFYELAKYWAAKRLSQSFDLEPFWAGKLLLFLIVTPVVFGLVVSLCHVIRSVRINLRRMTLAAMTIVGGGVGIAEALYRLHSDPYLADLLQSLLSIVIWDRSVYFFDRIPSRIEPVEAAVVVGVAIVSSLVGAVIPAIKAARVDPVESLRYE